MKGLQNSKTKTPQRNWLWKIKIFLIFTLILGTIFTPRVVDRLSAFAEKVSGSGNSHAANYVYVNGYPTLNGSYVDCNGNIDSDPGHHTTDPGDIDPAHHVGQNCPAGSVVANAATVAVAAQTTSTPPAAAASSVNYVYIKGYPTLNGNYIDCDGSIDNDMAHHTTDPSDTDSGHHLGQNCQSNNAATSGTVQSQPTTTNTVPVTTTTTNSSNPSNSTPVVSAAPVVTTPTVSRPSSNQGTNTSIFGNAKLYLDNNTDIANYVKSITYSDPYNAALLTKISTQPSASWFGDWNTNVASDANSVVSAAATQGALPVLVVYNIPNRDCGGYSSGGSSPDAYKQWVRAMAAGIGHRQAAIILEPDATGLIDCLSSTDLQTRYSLLRDAVSVFKNNGQAVYIDAGHPAWVGASDMASRLKLAGVNQADGFALNVSNFYTTADNTTYGQQISQALGGKHFIIDTGRNGNGPTADAQWCNPSGRALGQKPTTNTGNPLIDALLWVKGPGGSDGQCNGGPAAGVLWPSYAEGLASRAAW